LLSALQVAWWQEEYALWEGTYIQDVIAQLSEALLLLCLSWLDLQISEEAADVRLIRVATQREELNTVDRLDELGASCYVVLSRGG
jgi:hypothetical protein